MKVADNYERGAEGEEATARALTMLPAAEWTVLHDVRWPGRRFANIDHVAVGPGGVFVIDSKNWTGQVEVRDGVLRQNGYKREKEIAGAADAALAVAEVVPGLDPRLVTPVICLTSPELVGTMSREVMICSTATIAATLQRHPPVLDQASVRRLAGAVQFSLQNALRVPPPMSARQVRSLSAPTQRPAGPGPLASILRNFGRAFAGLALIALGLILAFGVVLPRLGDLAGGAAPAPGDQTGSAELALGAAQRLPRATGRPPLVVRADRIATTEATGGAPHLLDGNRFVAVRVTVRNIGKRPWRSQPGTTASLRSELGVVHQAYGDTATRAGKAFPSVAHLAPGQQLRGWLVAQVPIDRPIVGMEMTVGPGQPATAAWVIDRQ